MLTKIETTAATKWRWSTTPSNLNIEALTMLAEMARKQLLPAINAYMRVVADTAAAKRSVSQSISVHSELKTLERLSADADTMSDAIDELQQVVDAAEALTDETALCQRFP